MNRSEEIQRNVEKHMEKQQLPKELCHYTSLAAFFGIIKSGEFWIGNAASMNDAKEVIFFVDELKRELQKDMIDSSTDELNRFFDAIYTRIETEYPYVMCFSRLKDNAAQWERYADNAQGICIEFETRSLIKFFNDNYSMFNNVYYGRDIRQHEHFKLLKKYFENGIIPVEFSTGDREKDENGWIDNILAASYGHKHPSFISEAEVRAATLWGHTYIDTKKECVFVNGKIKEVLKMNISEQCKRKNIRFEDLIERIVVGAKSGQDISVLKRFLIEKGYEDLQDKIVKSECPLR